MVDGVGIPDDGKEMLNDSERRYEGRSGIGTGLYLATSVLEQVDGEISFADDYPRGTEVTVGLHPVTESE
ncbi:ATP-binding protein [Natronomonas salsuginis]|uniref:ATP-binding protein n=1 Tax=Natronomonas salsuginis TaxID=2217661 RepID=UPI00268203BD